MSRSQVRRAGARLRQAGAPSEDDQRIYDAYRDTFAEPLREVSEAIREMAGGVPVQSRLKRFETVVEKLRRGTSDLSRLEDIAGCRVVLPTMREQHQLLDRIRERWAVMRERDHQASPRDGYRARHIVVRAQDRPVEVQVRTELEDLWANASEKLATALDPAIKYGGGPPEVRGMLDASSRYCGGMDTLRAARGDLLADGLDDLARRLPDLQPAIELARSLIANLAAIESVVRSGQPTPEAGPEGRRAAGEAGAPGDEARSARGCDA